MAEQEEKSNFTLIVGVCAALSIALVLALKSRETEHLAYSNTSLEENASALSSAKRFENNFE
jgi:hypothetical protein